MISKKQLNIIIVDDEPSSREVLRIMIEKYDKDCSVVAEADSVISAVEKIKKYKPDLLFLDIELKNGTGFEVLEEIGEYLIPTIFVTAYDHYAIKAIKYNAFDYILKPVDYQELIVAIQNARNEQIKVFTNDSLQNYQYNKSVTKKSDFKIAVQHKGERVFILLSEIVYCLAEKSYTSIFLSNGRKILSSKNLGEFEKIFPTVHDFDDFFFYRIHHGSIVNTKYITKILSKAGLIELQNKQQLKISERRKSEFQKYIHLIFDVM